MKVITGGVTAPKGFEAGAVKAGIKYKDRMDMAVIYSQTPCEGAGVFTGNLIKAAPVLWDKAMLEGTGGIHAVIVNSGIANACTGKRGYACCEETAKAAAEAFHITKEAVLVASTGIIGMQLPIEKLKAGTAALAKAKGDSIEDGSAAARAIMTTDTVSKQAAVEIEIGGKTVTVGGMCKGSGMIHPNMCTMLGFITTDAAISKELLIKALREDVQDTFNMVSVDGDMSTNDTLLLLANGMAGNAKMTEPNGDYEKFVQALHYINETLAKKMAGDGEGATTLFEAKVIHAQTKEQAKLIAKSVICSNLTKAAIFGHDANWGRILCAMGYSGACFDPDNMDLFFVGASGSILLYRDGEAADYSEEEASKILSDKEVTVLIDLKSGDAAAAAWGCDLSYDYVKINADYRS